MSGKGGELRRRVERRLVKLLDRAHLASGAIRLIGLKGGQRGRRLAQRLARNQVSLPGQPVSVRRLGVRMELDTADNAQRMLFLTGTYEPEFLEFVARELRRGDVYVDVGGHIGIDAAVAARRLLALGGGHVYAFEPAPDSVERLRQLKAENKLVNLHVVPVALGDHKGAVALRADTRYSPRDAGVRSMFNDGPVVAEVTMTTLDSWAQESSLTRLDMLKIDVEGAELAVLNGAHELIARCRPRAIVVEFNGYRLQQAGISESDIKAVLGSMGYADSLERFLENAVFRPV